MPCIYKKLTKNKSFEAQLSKFDDTTCFCRILTEWTRKMSHAGCQLEIDIWKYHFGLRFYDCRHWNYEEGRWCTDDEGFEEEKDEFEDYLGI